MKKKCFVAAILCEIRAAMMQLGLIYLNCVEEREEPSYLYRPLKLGKSSSSRTLPKVPEVAISDKVCQHGRQRRASLPPIIWGEKSLLPGEGKLSEFTPANYNRPSRPITVQTLSIGRRGGVAAGMKVNRLGRMLKLTCGFEGCNAMRIVRRKCN